MGVIELPHTAGCLVCGRENPHGLRLDLHVDTDTGLVTVAFTPRPEHIGFEGIVHGGLLAIVVDEAMVWAATWAGRRFCVCGELNIRFRQSAGVGQTLAVTARADEPRRSRLTETAAEIVGPEGRRVASAIGKYVPVSAERNRYVLGTLVDQPATAPAASVLRGAADAQS